jgi:hypothetical protein
MIMFPVRTDEMRNICVDSKFREDVVKIRPFDAVTSVGYFVMETDVMLSLFCVETTTWHFPPP